MTYPSQTVTFTAALACIYSVLAITVVALRGKHNVPFGDGGVERLKRAIRAHANFAEWVPLTLMLVGVLESDGYSATYVTAVLTALVVARVLHPMALFSRIGSAVYYVGRIAGAMTTWLVMTISAVLLLWRSFG